MAKKYDGHLAWTDTGYRIVTQGAIPPDAINVETSSKRTRYSTRELVSKREGSADQTKRNSRMIAAQQEVFMLSDQVIEKLLRDVVAEMGLLYDCSESVRPRYCGADQDCDPRSGHQLCQCRQGVQICETQIRRGIHDHPGPTSGAGYVDSGSA